MLSFSQNIKLEISRFAWKKEDLKVLLYFLVKENSNKWNNEFKIDCHFKELAVNIKKSFNFLNLECHAEGKYVIITQDVFKQLKPKTLKFKEEELQAYVAGHFLARGNCNSPQTKTYHLELRVEDESDSIDLMDALYSFGIKTKIYKKNNWNVIYIKNKILISNFLALVNAHHYMMEFENEKIEKDFVNLSKRYDAFDEINKEKINKAHQEFVKKAKKMKEENNFEGLSVNLKRFIDFKIKTGASTIDELKNLYNNQYKTDYSKSSINNWIRKVNNYK